MQVFKESLCDVVFSNDDEIEECINGKDLNELMRHMIDTIMQDEAKITRKLAPLSEELKKKTHEGMGKMCFVHWKKIQGN